VRITRSLRAADGLIAYECGGECVTVVLKNGEKGSEHRFTPPMTRTMSFFVSECYCVNVEISEGTKTHGRYALLISSNPLAFDCRRYFLDRNKVDKKQ